MLNALRHHGGGHGSWFAWGTCAQRCSTPYGITAEVTAGERVRIGGGSVLNALRHHGGGHTVPRPPSSSRRPVLNALRHHGGGHRENHRRSGDVERVLNALRHHGGGHNDIGRGCGERHQCSTPYGITAEVTLRATRERVNSFKCSTPYGITAEVTLCAQLRVVELRSVLNALRHHGGGHAPTY